MFALPKEEQKIDMDIELEQSKSSGRANLPYKTRF